MYAECARIAQNVFRFPGALIVPVSMIELSQMTVKSAYSTTGNYLQESVSKVF